MLGVAAPLVPVLVFKSFPGEVVPGEGLGAAIVATASSVAPSYGSTADSVGPAGLARHRAQRHGTDTWICRLGSLVASGGGAGYNVVRCSHGGSKLGFCNSPIVSGGAAALM